MISTLRANPALQGLPFWIAASVVGFVATGYAETFLATDHFLTDLLAQHPSAIWWLSPLAFVLGWSVIHYFSQGAAGSGIPQVHAVFDIEDRSKYSQSIRRLLGARVWVSKIVSSLLGCLGGGSMANEGPTIQIASGISYSIGKRFQKIWPQLQSDVFIVAGAGAGVAAAFNTPLGGIVYSIEEFSSVHLHRFKTVLLTGVIISGFIAQWLVGSYLYLGFPRIEPITMSMYPFIILLSLVGGWLGALMGDLVVRIAKFRDMALKKTWQKYLTAIAMGLLIAVLYTYVNPRIVGGGRSVVVDMLFNGSENPSSLSLVISRFIGPLITYLSGVAGGFFAPALAAGGSLGGYFGNLVDPVHNNLYILLGMIAFMSGMTHLPFTSFILVLEMTDRHSAIFPMMMAAILAQASSRLINSHNLYERMKPSFLGQLKKDPQYP
ncbi:MAG: chloride channel protein [Bdellovibrionota bacterium]